MDLFRFRVTHSTERVWTIGRVRPSSVAWLVFIDWVIAYANEWEEYANCFGEGEEICRYWATAQSLVF